MKRLSWLSLFLIPFLALTGYAPASPAMQPTQGRQLPSHTILPATATLIPTLTLTPAIPDTKTPAPTATVRLATATPSFTMTPTLVDTLDPEIARATL